MMLKDLRISIIEYGDEAGKYKGKASFSGDAGSVELKLTPEMCNNIFRVCADGILETAQEAAQMLVCNVIDHQDALERI